MKKIELTKTVVQHDILFPIFNSSTKDDIVSIFKIQDTHHVFTVADSLVQHVDIECSDGVLAYCPFFRLHPMKRVWLLEHGWPLTSLVQGEFTTETLMGRRDDQYLQIDNVNSCYLLHLSASAQTVDNLKQAVYQITQHCRYNELSIRRMLQVTLSPIFAEKQQLDRLLQYGILFCCSLYRFSKISNVFLPQELRRMIFEIFCNQHISNGEAMTYKQIATKSTSLLRSPLVRLTNILDVETLEESTDALATAIAPSSAEFQAMLYH